MAPRKRTAILIGIIAVACVLVCHFVLLPVVRGVPGRQEVPRTSVPRDEAPPGRSEQSESGRSEDLARRQPSPDRHLPPGEALAVVLARTRLWHHIDLSRWRSVAAFAPMWERALPEVMHATEVDRGTLLDCLVHARSTRLRQVLLITVGVLGGSDVEALSPYLTQPGLTAACAFAIGRKGGSRPLEILRDQLSQPGLTRQQRESLYFGMAQSGADAIPELVEATEAWALLGLDASTSLPLEFVTGPSACADLRRIAMDHTCSMVRIAAIRGFVRSTSHGHGDLDWLLGLAEDESQPKVVRSAALRSLASLDPDRADDLIRRWIERADSDQDLLRSAFDACSARGMSRLHLGRIVQAATAPGPMTPAKASAVRALAASNDPLVASRFAHLFPQFDRAERTEALLAALGSGPKSTEALDAISGILEVPGLDRVHELYVIQLLSRSAPHRARAEAAAWRRYFDSEPDSDSRRTALLEVAPLLGASANGEILRAYKESDGFIPRIELAATLAGIPGNMEREESRNFLAGEVLPYLRERLPRETGAWLAYSGPRSPRVNPIAMTIGNLFGRFGESSDIAMLDSLGADFMATNANWPEPLKSRIHASLGEAAARAADLIVLRTQR